MEDHYILTGTISCGRVRPGHNCSVQFLIQKNNNDLIWHKLHSFPTKNQVKSDKYAQHITHNKKKHTKSYAYIYIYIYHCKTSSLFQPQSGYHGCRQTGETVVMRGLLW